MLSQPLISQTVINNGSNKVCPQSSACRWRGLIETYRPYLPVTADTPVITLLEGNTPLIPVPAIAAEIGRGVKVFAKYDFFLSQFCRMKLCQKLKKYFCYNKHFCLGQNSWKATGKK